VHTALTNDALGRVRNGATAGSRLPLALCQKYRSDERPRAVQNPAAAPPHSTSKAPLQPLSRTMTSGESCPSALSIACSTCSLAGAANGRQETSRPKSEAGTPSARAALGMLQRCCTNSASTARMMATQGQQTDWTDLGMLRFSGTSDGCCLGPVEATGS
jgi:hypothetical protein